MKEPRDQVTAAAAGAPQPAALAGRIASIDILRGLAVFGILIENMLYFTGPCEQWDLMVPLWPGALDRAVVFLLRWLEEGKLYSLYSLLFGLGLAMQFDRAGGGANATSQTVRRMFVLLGIGLVHAFLIWWGDILTIYALLGLLLVLFLRCGQKTLIRWAAGLWLVPPALVLSLMLLICIVPQGDEASRSRDAAANDAAVRAEIAQAHTAYANGGWPEIAAQRASDAWRALVWKVLGGFEILMMFLVGVWAARARIADCDARTDPLLRRLAIWALPTGLILHAVYAYEMNQTTPGSQVFDLFARGVCGFLGMPLLPLGYVAIVMRLAQRFGQTRWLSPLRAVGEMSLSNYLAHSIVGTLLAYRVGLGYYGQISPSLCMVIAVVLFALQIPFSNWWLSRFRFGPAEWLWRSAAYGRWQPLRR